MCGAFWLAHLVWLLPADDVALACDVLTVCILVTGLFLTYVLIRNHVSRRRAVVAATIPGVLSVVLLGGHLLTSDIPRWYAYEMSLNAPGTSVTQEISLARPIPIEDVAAAWWIISLRCSRPEVPLEAVANGQNEAEVGRLRSRLLEVVPGTPRTWARVSIYEEYARFAGRPLASWPQWWCLDVSPTQVAGRGAVSLTLRRPVGRPGQTFPPKVFIEMRRVGTTDRRYFGPSPDSWRLCEHTSVFRWNLTEDCRLWGSWDLDSSSSSGWVSDGSPSRGAGATEARKARPFIRLLVTLKDGRRLVL